jgi:hypothetical protein
MPSADDFDPDRYRRQVLEPARTLGGVLPADLLLRYAVPERAATDAEAFEAHVARILKHWRALKQKRVYQAVATGLLAAHADLVASDQVSYRYFAERRDEDRAAARSSLESMVTALAAGTGVVARSTVPLLYTALGGSLSEQDIEDALADHQVTVVAQVWRLPEEPATAVRSGLAANLRILGLKLAADAVFGVEPVRAGFRLRGGFRLDTEDRITREYLHHLRQEQAKRALNERKTAQDNVLATLSGLAGQPEELEALLLWQLVDVLRPQIEARLPARAIAAAAAALGLDPGEAADLALALTSQVSRDPIQVAAGRAFDSRDLFTARRLVHALPESDDLRRRIEAEVGRFEALVLQADQARQREEIEAEAELLTKALAIGADSDSDLRARLWSLPAPTPAGVVATVLDGRVQLEWRPGPARTGGVRYRVVRGLGSPVRTAGAGWVVAETTDLRAFDDAPPPGETLHYSVFAARGGDVWSPGTAAAGPVVVLPEVGEPSLETHEGAVIGSWQLPPGANDVVVTCRPDEPGESSSQEWPIAATPVGFRDPQVTAGTRYRYRIHTVFADADGQRRVSPGVVRRVTTETPLDAVPDLQVEIVPGEDPRLRLRWTTPARGSVSIYRHRAAMPWPLGAAVALDELSRHGRPVAAAIEDGADGISRMTAAHQDGRSFFTAMTVGTDRAVVGPTVSVTSADPIGRLRATRYEDRVRLQWTWPDGAHRCRVIWWAESDPGTAQAAECGRRRFHDDGGFEIAVDSRPTTVSVVTVRRDAAGEIVGPAVEASVPGADITVRYAFRRPARWTPWRPSRLVLLADRHCRLPPVTVVRSRRPVLPLRAESGIPVLHLPGLELSPGAPFTVALPEPDGDTAGTRLGCFFAGPAPAGITLVPADGRG